MAGPIRVVIADDSSLARSLLRSYYAEDGDFDIVGEARNGREAVDMVRMLRPNLVTMDLVMPVMGGLEAIEEIMGHRPVPILVVSSVADASNAYAAVARGAVDVTGKPSPVADDVAEFLAKSRQVASVPVITHIRSLQVRRQTERTPAAQPAAVTPGCGGRVFAIAASTGGPQALARILAALPADFPCPLLIAQHISDGFAAGMAEWLGSLSRLPVRLARGGETLTPGVVLVSPSESHMTVSPTGIVLSPRLPDDLYRPSCDTLLSSVASIYGRRAVGLVLTGMGSDGARGLERIRQAGGQALVQDEASSVVFGMNRVAIERGLAHRVLPLEAIAGALLEMARPQAGREGAG